MASPVVHVESAFCQVMMRNGVMASATKIEVFEQLVVLHGPRIMVSMLAPKTVAAEGVVDVEGVREIQHHIELCSRRVFPMSQVIDISVIEIKHMNEEVQKQYTVLSGIELVKV